MEHRGLMRAVTGGLRGSSDFCVGVEKIEL
jgi:hypothetical protein